MDYFSPLNIGIFLIDMALALHCIRSGRSPIWILAMGAASFMGGLSLLVLLGVWIAYLAMAVIPDFLRSHGTRRFADNMVKAADPGRAYREKKRDAERVGSADAKRALAEESIKRGLFADAVTLYESAMAGPLGESDPTLLKGLARARLLSGDAVAAEGLLVKLKALDPAAFDADCELDYARALEEQGKNDDAVRQYEVVVPRYPGEEARARFALLLERLGQTARAQGLFRDVVESARGAPRHYKDRQGEWVKVARQHLKN